MKQRLSNSEIKELDIESISKKDIVESETINNAEILSVNGSKLYFKYNQKWVPTLRHIYAKEVAIKSITVDAGAVKFVTNGADVMRPGVRKIDPDIISGDIIAVKEETHNKTLALCESLFSSEEMSALQKGKIAKNIHYIGDFIWNLKND